MASASPELPLILAGPIVRRADGDGVYVWLATSRQLDDPALRVSLLTCGRGQPTLQLLPTTDSTTPAQLGAHLWIYLLGAGNLGSPGQSGNRRPRRMPVSSQRLPAGQLLAYDVVERGGAKRSLKDMLTLEEVVLEGLPLPTFVLQAPRQALHMMYASCRKMHGIGNDATPAFLRVLQRNARTNIARAQTLILGGDQIYADDVADLLLPHLSRMGAALVGRQEGLPGVDRPDQLPLRARAEIVASQGKFTAGAEAANHLMTFGEWAAAYIFAWNPDVWPATWATPVESHQAMHHANRPTMQEWLKSGHPDQSKRLDNARAASAAARRVLANVATYMIFDDHEITDDWNLNPRWTDRVVDSRLGSQLIYNGLAAYWAFQAWGNDPVKLRDVGATIATALASDADRDHKPLSTQTWSFLVPSVPRTAVLDTRTLRDRSPHSRAPRLLNAKARANTFTMLREAKRYARCVVVLTPSPVWGVGAIEEIQGISATFQGAAAADLESWTANPRSKADLVGIARALRLNPFIVLSGDVHYGFTKAARLFTLADKRTRRGDDMLVAQFTSSATKNVVGGGLAKSLYLISQMPPDPVDTWTWVARHDGSIHTVDTPLNSYIPGGPAMDAQTAAARGAALQQFGEPSWIERSTFQTVNRFLALDGVLVQENNVGEVVIHGEKVTHRHWDSRGMITETKWDSGAAWEWNI